MAAECVRLPQSLVLTSLQENAMTPSLLPMSSPPVVAVQPPRLLDQVAQAARQRGASQPTTAQLVSFVRAFVLFHSKCHPRELGLPAVTRFLEHIVRAEKQPLPALETARSALELLYGPVLGIDLGELPRPQPPRLLDPMSQVLRVRHYSPRTEACYCH
jgi:AcrR family transcriptional regulator